MLVYFFAPVRLLCQIIIIEYFHINIHKINHLIINEVILLQKLWSKPVLLVSRCLTNNKCRYDGTNSPCSTLDSLKEFTDIIEICPEVDIGLPTPRNPVRLISKSDEIRLVQVSSEKDYTDLMKTLSNDVLTRLDKIEGFLLKSKSPSCGMGDVRIYSSLDKGSSFKKGSGIFSQEIENHFSHIPIEDDGRIKNFTIRENFLTKIFTLASFNSLKDNISMKDLIDFHSSNKLLLMSFSQVGMKRLGKIVANHDNLSLEELTQLYYAELCNILKRTPRYTSIINVMNHALGYFNDDITKDEQIFIEETIDKYRVGKVPLSVPLNLLKGLAIRFKNEYLLNQSFLEPYPEELIDISDSGKGVSH